MRAFLVFLTLVACAAPAIAQPIPPASPPPAAAQPAAAPAPQKPAAETTISDRREGSNDQKDWHFIGHVEMDRGGDTKIYADDVRMYTGEDRAIATGNVLFAQGNNRIAAERAEFNTETRLGTFYNAWGLATVKAQPQAARPGTIAAPINTQENVVYFFGEKIEKIGPKKYRITNGGFSTCVQPTPRWDLHAGTVLLNVDHYTLLTNAVMTVKGVPMLYLPILYYPTKREDRATGFLIPTYGTSSLRGQSIHDAFFWAINRSQDATIMHDWYSKTGQGVGSEYRYNFGPGANGNLLASMLDEHSTTYVLDDGTENTTSASRSYDIRGSANQILPGNLRAGASISYFSSIVSSQTFNTNIYDASRNSRSIRGNVAGAWRGYTMNGTLDYSEYFYDANNSAVNGSWPRIALARSERPIGNSPVYVSLNGEVARLLARSKTSSTDPETGVTTSADVDNGLGRVDFAPQIRYPFKKWQWFTINNTVVWHQTYYARSYALDADGNSTNTVVDVPLNRPVFTYQAQIVGPVFNRVWDTPGSGYAEKFKHTIEPVLTIDRTSDVPEFQRVVRFDGVDFFVGGARYTYGVNNRFYAKRKQAPGQPAISRDIVDVEISQSYYTNQAQSLIDRQYQTTLLSGNAPSNFSPISLRVRAMPTNEVNATVSAEFDSRYHSLRTISAQGGYSTPILQTSVGWSKRGLIPELQGFNDPAFLDQSINVSTNLRTRDNKYGTQYSATYDVLRGGFTQQSIQGFYNAQCCGLAVQYQTFNYGVNSFSPIPADHRFFLSFTLAGLGNFSPMNGALGGVPR